MRGRRLPRRLVAAGVGCLVAAALAPPPATAQPALASIRLVAQPVWHSPDDSLGIVIEVDNASDVALEDLTLGLQAYARITTRSALEAFFGGNPGLFASGTSVDASDVAVPAGGSREIEIDMPLQEMPSLAAATEGGVYPLEISLGAAGAEIATLQTPLILYPETPKARLGLVLSLPLGDAPARDPLGSFPGADGGFAGLDAAVTEGGWLADAITALEDNAGELPPLVERVEIPPKGRNRKDKRPRIRVVRTERPSVHLGLVPLPRTIEELADMADGFRREEGEDAPEADAEAAGDLLTRLRELVAEEGVQILPTTYAAADLPELALNAPEELPAQLSVGGEVLSQAFGPRASQSEWLSPWGARIDQHSLSELPRPPGHLSLSVDSVEPPVDPDAAGCPETFASFACAVSVPTRAGRSKGFVIDAGLQDRLAALRDAPDPLLARQRFFAETATIHQEIPSVPGRVVHGLIPALWHPRRARLDDLLHGLRSAPWLRTMSPQEALEDPDVQVSRRQLVTGLPALRDALDATFYEGAADTRALVGSFDLVRPPTDVVRRLARNVLVAEGPLLWDPSERADRAESYLTSTREQIGDELGGLSLGGQADIRLTSSEGEVPLVLFNEAPYPVTVDIDVTTQPDLEVKPATFEDQRIEPGSTYQFTLNTRATSSGIFQMVVAVESPDGDITIDRKIVRVRSTRFNRVALTITFAAFAFLVLTYAVRVVRRRRSGDSAEG